jgi:hypothetical protein
VSSSLSYFRQSRGPRGIPEYSIGHLATIASKRPVQMTPRICLFTHGVISSALFFSLIYSPGWSMLSSACRLFTFGRFLRREVSILSRRLTLTNTTGTIHSRLVSGSRHMRVYGDRFLILGYSPHPWSCLELDDPQDGRKRRPNCKFPLRHLSG